jgi:hypothetical protein
VNHGRADLDLISRTDLALVHTLPVHHRSRLVAEIDERDVAGTGDLDDRVHARREVVIDAQMTARVLSDLHDVLSDRVPTYELIALVERERQRNLRFAFHRFDLSVFPPAGWAGT